MPSAAIAAASGTPKNASAKVIGSASEKGFQRSWSAASKTRGEGRR